MLDAALACTGLKDPATGQPLHYTPHDFRRIFITDAVMSGLPPHIAQVIAGHRDINTTMGYKAVYPEEAIQSHLAFLARRRAQRPTDEYRVPSDEEWQEFLGHFERRKVATGICGRAFGTPCIHEHSCLRCSMHWPDPAQRPRIAEIRGNLIDRIAEAGREGWAGEVEGLKVSLAGRKPAPAMPTDELTAALRACAAGLYPLEAGVALLTAEGTFLRRDDFTSRFITVGTSISDGTTLMAAIDWDTVITALRAGEIPCSAGERRVLMLSASLAGGIPVDLRGAATGLDDRNVQRLVTAILHASGKRPEPGLHR
jgi:hypothetical protein